MRVPLWLKLAYTLMVCVIIPVYWRDLGPGNFLWFSDIALILLVPALWLENRFIASMMAVSVLLLEIAWVLDFLTGGNLLRIAAYMFAEGDDPAWHIRVLSGLFHLAIPPVLLFMLLRFGYDRRALPAQIALTAVVLPVTYLVTGPADNVNWVYGPAEPQDWIPSYLYLALLMLAFVFLVYLPSHWLFKKLFAVHPQQAQTGADA